MRASVIMAAHNSAAFIGAAIESALTQSERDLELIVVDDGSSDGTADVVKGFMGADPRVRLLRHDASLGAAAARNTALDQARGDWIVILDSDDRLRPDRLQRMIPAAEARALDLLADNLATVDFDTGADLGRAFAGDWMDFNGEIDLAWIFARDWPGQVRPMSFGYAKPIIRRAYLEARGLRYDPELRSGEDLLLYARCALSGARFGVTPDTLYIYSIRKDSISRPWQATRHLCDVNDRILGLIDDDAQPELARLARKRGEALQYEMFSRAWKGGDWRLAWRSSMRMPLGYLARRVTTSVARRMGRA